MDLIEHIRINPIWYDLDNRSRQELLQQEAFPLTRHQNNSGITATLELNRFEQAALPPVVGFVRPLPFPSVGALQQFIFDVVLINNDRHIFRKPVARHEDAFKDHCIVMVTS